MHLSSRICFALISVIPAVICQLVNAPPSTTNGTWLYPDPTTKPTFNSIDTLNASWTSNFVNPWLHLMCTTNSSSNARIEQHYNATVASTGSIEVPLNYETQAFGCHFELSRTPEIGLGPPYVMGSPFNVVVNDNAKPVLWTNTSDSAPTASTSTSITSSTSVQAITSITSSSRTATIARNTASASSSAAPASKAHKTHRPDTGTITGIAIAVTLGVLAMIVISAFLLLQHRKHKHTKELTSKTCSMNFAKSQEGWTEMPADIAVAEKQGSSVAGSSLMAEKQGSHIPPVHPLVAQEKQGSPVAAKKQGSSTGWMNMGELEAPR